MSKDAWGYQEPNRPMFASIACMVKAGDRVVASAAMFSSCHVVLTEFLPAWGPLFRE